MIFTGAALAAVLGPLLLLYGFKFGVVEAMLTQLNANPESRRIKLLAEQRPLNESQIATLRQLPGVAFIEPMSRSIAGRSRLEKAEASVGVDVMPTGPGDPLLPAGLTLAQGEAMVSFPAAADLGLSPGDEVYLFNERFLSNRTERLRLRFRVRHIAARGAETGRTVFVQPSVIEEIERFKDGYAVPDQGVTGTDPRERVISYPYALLYAGTLQDVRPLVTALTAMGYRVSSRADEVEGTLTLSRNLATVFGLVALVGASGYTVSLSANLAATIRQKRRLLSLLRLMGASRLSLLFFPLAQAFAIASVGFMLSTVIFFVVSRIANSRFSGSSPGGEEVCYLTATHFAAAAAATGLVALLVVVLVSRSLASIAPAQVLHEG